MTYSHAVIWLWVLALGATLVAFALAWRALGRADGSLARLQAAAGADDDLALATDGAESVTRAAALARRSLHDRTIASPGDPAMPLTTTPAEAERLSR